MKIIFLSLPIKIAEKLGVILSYLAENSLPGRRKLVIKNLSNTFKNLEYRKILSIAKNFWRNLGRTTAEFIKLQQINKKNYIKFVEFENEENLKDALKVNKGVLLLTAHIGNWELMGAALSLRGYKIMVIARPLKNIYVNNEINRIRESSNEKVVEEHRAVRESLRWLKSNGCIGILIDQHIVEGEVVVDFLGRQASTTPIVALLAKKTGAKVVPLYNYHLDSGKIRIVFERPVELKETGNQRNDLIVNTAMFNKIIENWIFKYPEEWFWVHNRWKVAP